MSDRLTIKQYWKRMVLVVVELMVVSAALFVLADMQNAELPSASGQSQLLAVIFIVLIAVNGLAAFIYALVTILRRARDTGYTVSLFLLGAIVPLDLSSLGQCRVRSRVC